MTGEGSGKLLSHLSSKSTGSNPSSTISLACAGINDAAFCSDGGRLAVACRDGSVRLLEWPSGACLGGYQVGFTSMFVVVIDGVSNYNQQKDMQRVLWRAYGTSLGRFRWADTFSPPHSLVEYSQEL
jgi:WD40 repeat protein